jgi:hypothetical protein
MRCMYCFWNIIQERRDTDIWLGAIVSSIAGAAERRRSVRMYLKADRESGTTSYDFIGVTFSNAHGAGSLKSKTDETLTPDFGLVNVRENSCGRIPKDCVGCQPHQSSQSPWTSGYGAVDNSQHLLTDSA